MHAEGRWPDWKEDLNAGRMQGTGDVWEARSAQEEAEQRLRAFSLVGNRQAHLLDLGWGHWACNGCYRGMRVMLGYRRKPSGLETT